MWKIDIAFEKDIAFWVDRVNNYASYSIDVVCSGQSDI